MKKKNAQGLTSLPCRLLLIKLVAGEQRREVAAYGALARKHGVLFVHHRLAEVVLVRHVRADDA